MLNLTNCLVDFEFKKKREKGKEKTVKMIRPSFIFPEIDLVLYHSLSFFYILFSFYLQNLKVCIDM